MAKVTTLVLAALAMAAAGCVSGSVEKRNPKASLRERAAKRPEDRRRIAVVDFEDKSQYGAGRLGTSAADQLTTYLVKSRQFNVYDRKDLAKVLDEQKLGQSGIVDPATAARVGKIIAVEYVVIGTISNFGMRTEAVDAIITQNKKQIAESKVLVKVINVETSAIVFAGEGDGVAERSASGMMGLGGRTSYDETLAGDSLNAAILQMVDDLIDEIEMNP
ncbi:MAG: hypothetical protein HY716_10310 [Planctomycetes bacterium]|nr:hypothetical protein [Planctomycetota bacterium]